MSTTDGWLKLNFASCVIRQTRSLGVLVLCSIKNITVFVNYIYDREEPGRVSVWSLQSDGFVSIGNAARYGCAVFGCSEFVCVLARAHSLHLSAFVCLSVSGNR